jgi:filamentous hemagglutinin family protein
MKRHASMNRIYRLVWNTTINALVVVAENARGRGKSSGRKLVAAALALTGGLFLTPLAMAGPTGGQVVAGSGSIAQTGNTTTINQASQNLSLNWQSFGIAANESVRFNQPSASSIALNRILGQSPSQIFGSLSANGQVFLLNPNGVLFAPGSQVNVGGLVASTLGLSDADFMAGKFSFSKGSVAGTVVNQGTLTAAQGGYIALLAPEVRNEGVISATMGTALLAAGDKVSINLNKGSLLSYNIDQGAINALADNKQLIQADGGQVFMSAKAADALSIAVVNNTGIVEARTVQNVAGTIRLMSDMSVGTVNLAGTLDASAANGGNGGFIETSAAHVKIANDAKVTTAATSGLTGSWLIDPVDFTIAATGGDMTGTALSTALGGGNVTILSSSGAAGTAGNVNVNDVVSWNANKLTLNAQNNININASMYGSGTASLVFEYGQGALSLGNTSDYFLNNGAQVNLSAGQNFSTKLGSDGSAVNYTVITDLGAAGSSTATDLQGMSGNLAGHYVLGTNIDASATSGWNAGFKPIGYYPSTSFSGRFDGFNHIISNLFINLPGPSNSVGLISFARNSLIQNVGLVDVKVTGSSFVGGLVGTNYGSINNSYATGNVTGTGSQVGGLIGQNGVTGGVVNKSYFAGNVSGINNVGGLVGISNYGSITNSYSSANVTGSIGVGGLVGSNNNSSIINNSYALGSATGTHYVGGVVGLNNGIVTEIYAKGTVLGTSQVGGIVGMNAAGTIRNGYWNSDIQFIGVGADLSQTTTGGGLTTSQMQSAANFTGFNFTTTPDATGNNWVMVNVDGTLNNAGGATGATYPMLASEYSTTINNSHQLQLMAMNTIGSYKLGQDINATATGNTSDIWSGATFIPVGNAANPFTGTFDGLGHAVSNLAITLPTTSYVGLFGYTGVNSEIRNIGLMGVGVSGQQYVGGLVGQDFGIINNSYATGSVNGSNYVGGLVGYSALDSISNSYAAGSVSGNHYVGGLVGLNYGTIKNNSYATGKVSGSNYVGGLVGKNSHLGNISNSYATGGISGNHYVGELVGLNYGTINNSYATGSVSGSNYVGGLVGKNSHLGNISNSYAAGSASGNHYVGGLVGLDYGTINNSYATGSVSGSNYVGGLVGNNSLLGNISNSYAAGSVSGNHYVGGLVGLNYGAINNSYATGGVSGSNYVGGLVGSNNGIITSSFWNQNTTGQLTSAGGTGQTTSQMQIATNFTGWNISNTGGSGAVWRIYEGHTAPLLTNFLTPLTLTGAPDVTVTYNGTLRSGASISAPDGVLGSTATGTNAGFYNGYYSTQQGYDITGGNLTIAPLAVNVANLTGNKIYDGTTIFSTGQLGISNIVGSDVVSLSAGSANTFSKNVGTWALSSFSGLALTGANAVNYTLIGVSGTGTITPATLTVKNSVASNKVYNGTTTATLTGGVLSGLIAGDAVSLNQSGTFASKNVGTGIAITATDSLSGAQAGNYIVSQPTGLTANITPLTITVSAKGVNKVYDGTVNDAVTFASTGVISGDSVSFTDTSATFANKNVGTAKVVTVKGIALSGVDAANYKLGNTSLSTIADITPLAITVSATALNKVYDGTVKDLAQLTSSGVIAGDVVKFTNTSVAFSDKNAGNGKTVTVSGIKIGSRDGGNYTINTTATTTANITPKGITVTAKGSNKVYDGTVNDTVMLAVTRVIRGDVISFTNTSATFADKNAGAAKVVTVSGIAASGADAGNYTYNTVATTTGKITQKTITVAATGTNKVYDGTVNDVVSLASLGVLSGDVVNFADMSATFANNKVGAGKVVTVKGITASGADALNYRLGNTTATTTASITP